MNAGDIMTRDVLTVHPATPLLDALQLMLDRRVSGMPVVDAAGRVLGILTEGDLLRRAETGTEKQRPRWQTWLAGAARIADDYVHTHSRKVGDVMTGGVISVTAGTPLCDVVDMMERHHIKRVPVLDDGRLAGIVSRTDLLRALLKALPTQAAPPADDMTLRGRVLAELGRHEWGKDGRVEVSVQNGSVKLQGVVFDTRERDAMRVCAENVPGVNQVTDQLEYLDPNIGVIGIP